MRWWLVVLALLSGCRKAPGDFEVWDFHGQVPARVRVQARLALSHPGLEIWQVGQGQGASRLCSWMEAERGPLRRVQALLGAVGPVRVLLAPTSEYRGHRVDGYLASWESPPLVVLDDRLEGDWKGHAAHEYAHFVQFQLDPGLPLWTSEVVAQVAAWDCGQPLDEAAARTYPSRAERPLASAHGDEGGSLRFGLFLYRRLGREWFGRWRTGPHGTTEELDASLREWGRPETFRQLFRDFAVDNAGDGVVLREPGAGRLERTAAAYYRLPERPCRVVLRGEPVEAEWLDASGGRHSQLDLPAGRGRVLVVCTPERAAAYEVSLEF